MARRFQSFDGVAPLDRSGEDDGIVVEVDVRGTVSPMDSARRFSLATASEPARWEMLARACALVAPHARMVAAVVSGDEGGRDPRLATAFPFPLYVVPRRAAISCAAPDGRVVVLDLDGAGCLTALEPREFAERRAFDLAVDLRSLLGVAPYDPSAPRDLGTELARRQFDGGTLAAPALEPVFAALRALGFTTIACASGCFDGFEAIELRAAGATYVVPVIAPRQRAAAALECVARMRHGNGISAERGPSGPVFVMSGTRPVRYRLAHVDGVFDPAQSALAELAEDRPPFFVIDSNVDALYGAAIRRYARARLRGAHFMTLRASELEKSLETAQAVCREAAGAMLPRNGVIVGVGGGVALDIAGFAASVYRRGIGYIRVPTTLIGMVDVAVGIKHAVNDGGRKSLIGSFFAPIGGINDVGFLRTVPIRCIAGGVAEIAKIALIADAALFDELEMNLIPLMATNFMQPRAAAMNIIARAELAMLRELEPNLFETDLQRAVDFGHTFSPRIETAAAYRIGHGEAVAIDMLVSTAIGIARGATPPSLLARLATVCRIAGLPFATDACRTPVLMEALEDARRHRGGKQHFPVPGQDGAAAFLQDVGAADIDAALHAVRHVAPEPACRRS